MARHKMRIIECSVIDAVSNAIGELEGLAEEVREVVDGAEGGRAETQRIQTLGAFLEFGRSLLRQSNFILTR